MCQCLHQIFWTSCSGVCTQQASRLVSICGRYFRCNQHCTAFVEELTDHINRQDKNIKFTRGEEVDGQLPFLDTLISRKPDGSFKVKVYRKKTHTDQYLNFASHHPLEHKLSVVRTLLHRSNTFVTEPEDKAEEISHLKEALHNCGYGERTVFRARPKEKQVDNAYSQVSPGKHIFTTLPYVEGLSEKLKRAFTSAGVSTSFKHLESFGVPQGQNCPGETIWSHLQHKMQRLWLSVYWRIRP